ncbi:hypothetical protein X748_15325 [Mesorhizobium sp. LNJC386A00]|nr:hypothetical protein X752_14780 [Mesorhizobium sp. LNJC398B00]ESY22441.1 hypothetical protein X751_08415 [Mesorhizobium sp. LNJC395A00]ESY35839.1 hypothetical protein X748_15325 [Mesorhizobium sp. LNJC386A00]ESY41445.1 hypothetical protein X746_25775 [Mesorhizobium sp. LNJC380A00]
MADGDVSGGVFIRKLDCFAQLWIVGEWRKFNQKIEQVIQTGTLAATNG